MRSPCSSLIDYSSHAYARFVEIRSISLRENVDASYVKRSSPSPENWRRLELPPYPVYGDRNIQDVDLIEGILVVTVAIFGEHNDMSFHVLLMNTEIGELRWVDPKFTKVQFLSICLHACFALT